MPSASVTKAIAGAATVVLIALVAFALSHTGLMPEGSVKASQPEEQAEQIVENVRKLIRIPEARPTVAEIKDVVKLRLQNRFYEAAENGDYVVLTEERAILYSTEDNMIIDVFPLRREVSSVIPDSV